MHSSFKKDRVEIIEEAKKSGVKQFIITGTNVHSSHMAAEYASKYPGTLFSTSGVHPHDAKTCNGHTMFELEKISKNDSVVAIGECGLDYDRLHYSIKEDQLKLFDTHFNLAQKYNLPMYLHNRNTGDDFYNILKENRNKFSKGIVHSFTGTEDELNKFLSLDMYIGLTGTSFKTKENLEVIKKIPVDKLCIETDAPYCEIKSSSAAFKFIETTFKDRKKKEKMQKGFMCKDRNEPCAIIQVLEALAKIKQMDKKELAIKCYENSINLFNIK